MFPLLTEGYDILRHRVLTETVVTKAEHIGFVLDKVHYTIFINKTDGDDIVALAEKTLRNVITTRGILVMGFTYLLTVEVGYIMVEKCT